MKVYGRPEFILNFYKYMHLLIADIDTQKAFPDLVINLVTPAEMPTGHINMVFPHYNPTTKAIWLPILEEIEAELYFRYRASTFAHEVGHYAHFKYMPNEKIDDPKWLAWAALTGKKLDFKRIWGNTGSGASYTIVPSQEDFANEFSFALRGERPFKHKQFYYNLWGQELKEEKRMIEMWLGSTTARVNGKPVTLDVAPRTENGRTLIPVRFVAEQMGAKVTWFPKEKKIVIE